MKRKRNPFDALLSMCKKNGLYQKSDGTWTIDSSTNRKRMLTSGRFGDGGSNAKPWVPAKILITSADLEAQWEKQGKVCYWFKIPLDFDLLYKDHPNWYPKHPGAPSVDKINESGDYTPDNIVITCRFANLGRNIYPHDKMVTFMEHIKKGIEDSK